MMEQAERMYAMLLADGSWARIYTAQTHGGDKQRIHPVSLNQATVMQKHQWRPLEGDGVLVEVEEVRTVTVKLPVVEVF